MSLPGVNSGVDDALQPEPEPGLESGSRSREGPGIGQRLPVPVAGTLLYAGMRLVGVAMSAFMLRHGNYRRRRRSLLQWMGSSDGGHYRDIAAHGYAYPPGQ